MKKLSLNAKFITTSLFCLALLAVPALAVQGQALYYAAPQPRPQVPGVMSDEVRLDPLAGALYRYGVQGGSSTPQSYDITKDVFTVLRGKLRQAAARSLLTNDQLTYLLAQLDAGAGIYPGSKIPGEGGTILVAGHTATFFRDFEHAQNGAQITVTTVYGTYVYEITDMQVATDTDTSAYDLDAAEENIILYTCYPLGQTALTDLRYFIYGRFVSGPALEGLS